MTIAKDEYIRFDWAVKRLLRQKANFAVLEGFLTVLLGDKTTIVEILESESNQTSRENKFNRVDIKALNSHGEIIIVEVQNSREMDYLKRVLYGTSRAITEHINLGEDYDNVKKVYSVSILYFDLGEGKDYIYHGTTDFIGLHTHDRLLVSERQADAIIRRPPSEIFPEYYLIRVNEFNKVATTPLEEWVAYLKTGKILPTATAPGLPEARQQLQYYSMSPEERRAYERHVTDAVIERNSIRDAHDEGREEGRKEGRKEGLEKGRKEALLQVAKTMKAAGTPLATIVQFTGLNSEEIKRI